MARIALTAQLFDDLYVDAMGGDSAARESFYDYASKLAKRVNQQMLSAERRGVDSQALRLYESMLDGKKRFKENVSKMVIDDLRKQVDDLLIVSGQKDYSIPYAEKSAEQIEKITQSKLFEAAGIDVSNKSVTYQLNEFLKTEVFAEYAKIYSGTNVIRAAEDAFIKGRQIDDLVAAYNLFKSSSDSPDMVQIWKEWHGKKI